MDDFRCKYCNTLMTASHWFEGEGRCQRCALTEMALLGLGLVVFDTRRPGMERFRRRVSIETIDKEK